jgi:hypothetical protein
MIINNKYRLPPIFFLGLFVLLLSGCGGGGSGSSDEDGDGNSNDVVTAPSISSSPASQTVALGSNATFTVSATGDATLTYQWQKDSDVISGATSSSYTITSTDSEHAASYRVVVTNSAGSATSNAAVLTVTMVPVISSHPVAQAIGVGDNTTFSVTAVGAGTLSYQWLVGSSEITGATNSSYTLSSATTGDAASYSVAVTNSYGSVTSNTASLAVHTLPTITTQPVSQSSELGGNTSFNVTAVGAATLTYQWKKGNADISGATSANYSIINIVADDAAAYSVVVSNSQGDVTSYSVNLLLNAVLPVSWEDQFSLASLNIDPDGWSNLVPSADSRLIFVSNSGDDATGEIYSSADIGSDPHHPTGTINAFKTINVAMRNRRDGEPDWLILKRGDTWVRDEFNTDFKFVYFDTENGSNSFGSEAVYSYDDVSGDPYNPPASVKAFKYRWKADAVMSATPSPYWVLEKNGDQWVTSAVTTIRVKEGRSLTERSVITYYGDNTDPRPLVKTGNDDGLLISSTPYVAVMGINFYANKRNPDSPYFVGFDTAANVTGFYIYTNANNADSDVNNGILIEDCKFNFYGNNIVSSANHIESYDIVIRRSQILNNYGTGGHSQGLSSGHSSIFLEENIFDHNGWYKQADGNGYAEGQATIFNHNSYLSSSFNTIFRNNVFSRGSSMNTKFTANSPLVYYDADGILIPDDQLGGYERSPGGYIILKPGIITSKDEVTVTNLLLDNNFYFGGEIAMSVGGNNDMAEGYRWQNIHILNNVITQVGRAEGSDGRGTNGRTLGWSMEIKDWDTGNITNNYIVNVGDSTVVNTYGISLQGHFNDVDISENVIANIANGFGILINGGIETPFGGPKIDVSVFNNDIHLPGVNTHLVRTEYIAPDAFYDNRYYSGRSSDSLFELNKAGVNFNDWVTGTSDTSTVLETPLNHVNEGVSLATYNASLVGTATEEAFLEEAVNQSRYDWDSRYTAEAINNYFRSGYTVVQ